MTKQEQLKWLLDTIDDHIKGIECGELVPTCEKTVRDFVKLEKGSWAEIVTEVKGLQTTIILPDTKTTYKIFGENKESLVSALRKFKIKLTKSDAFKNLKKKTPEV